MPKYINPNTMTIQQFLNGYGTEITVGDFLRSSFTEQNIMQQMHVILVDEGTNKVALILNDDFEHQQMKKSIGKDQKPKTYYTVPLTRLEPYL